jgi:hypothetical protein
MSLDPRLNGATINTCPHCHIRVEPGRRFFWFCDASHPELLAWLDQREGKTQAKRKVPNATIRRSSAPF